MAQTLTATDVKRAIGRFAGARINVSNDFAQCSVERMAHNRYVVNGRDGDNSEHPNAYRALGHAVELIGSYT